MGTRLERETRKGEHEVTKDEGNTRTSIHKRRRDNEISEEKKRRYRTMKEEKLTWRKTFKISNNSFKTLT